MHAAAVALQTATVAYLVLADPFFGAFKYREMEAAVESGAPEARSRFYQAILLVEWWWVAVTAVSLYLTNKAPADIGLRPLTNYADIVKVALPLFAVGLAASHAVAAIVPKAQRLSLLIPVTRRERLLWTATALTAGICEEILFRGLLPLYVTTLLPSLPWWTVLGLSSAAFGWAHLYQGWKGMLTSGIMGLLLGALYRATGSLYLPIAVHVLIDLNLLGTSWLQNRQTGANQKPGH